MASQADMSDGRKAACGDSRDAVAAWLSDPATHELPRGEVKRIDTHGATVFLAGSRAFKIKRPVRFAFMDFSSLEKRRAACEREVEINRVTAPAIYRGVRAITREPDGTLAFDGAGEVVEWAVEMTRFDENATLDRIAEGGSLDPEIVETLAGHVVDMHAAAPVVGPEDPLARLRAVASGNIEGLREQSDLFDRAAVEHLADATEAAQAANAELIVARTRHGLVRRCHGDLHLGNVALIEADPVIFDAVEFDEEIATIDVLYDLAFLLMDLWVRDEQAAANRTLNRWIELRREPLDLAGLALLPLYLSMRAAVRAKVAGLRAQSAERDRREATVREAREMFAAAWAFLDAPAPVLVAVGGLSGTGKSTLGRRLAPHLGAAPGAVHVRSDIERKALFEVPTTTRLSRLAYSDQMTRSVYARLSAAAGAILGAGHAAVVDAVFARPAERAAIEAVARGANCRFLGLWLEAPADVMTTRVGRRQGDASDATPDVVREQLDYETGEIAWNRIDASGTPEDTLEHALEALRSLNRMGG